MRKSVCLVRGLLLACIIWACEASPTRFPLISLGSQTAFDLNQLNPHSDTFATLNHGKEFGQLVCQYHWDADTLTIIESTEFAEANLAEEVHCRINARQGHLHQLRISGKQGDQPVSVQVDWDEYGRWGQSLYPRSATHQRGPVSIADSLPDWHLDASTFPYLLPALTRLPFDTVAVKLYDARFLREFTMQLMFEDTARIQVPAGSFDTYRLSLQGGSSSLAVYLSQSLPRQLIKLEDRNLPWSIEKK